MTCVLCNGPITEHDGSMTWADRDGHVHVRCLFGHIANLEAENAALKQEVKEYWCADFERESVAKGDGWYVPYMSGAEYASEALTENGIVERHPDKDGWYRYVRKETDDE